MIDRAIDNRRGFTLIEMLVVISIIGILASIGIVSYIGYRNSVIATTLKSDLSGAATAMENSRNFVNAYPASVPSTFVPSEHVTLVGGSLDGTTFCIDANSSENASIEYYIDETTTNVGAQPGDCASRAGSSGSTCADVDKYGTYPNCYDYDALPIASSISGYWSSPPTGYLLEDGSAVSRTTYADLFAVIGTTYGAGDGSTTFNLPDSRGRVAVNRNPSDSTFDVVGEKQGSKTHTLTINEMPSHNHGGGSFSSTTHGHGLSGWVNYFVYPDGRDSYDSTNQQEVANVHHIHPYSGWTSVPSAYSGLNSQGGGGAHNNIQPSIVKSFAIKYAPSTGNYSMLPAGTSISGYFSSAPTGYLLEDGSAVSRTTYSDLFAAVGTTFGSGDGSTTFNLPDSRGRVAVNRNPSDTEFDSIGETYGEKSHTLSVDRIPSHDHSSSFATNNHQHYYSGNSGTLNYPAGKDSYDETNEEEAANTGHVHPYSGWTGVTDHPAYGVNAEGGGQAHNEIQPSIVKTFIIKHTPAEGEVDTLSKGTSVQGYWTTPPVGYLLEDGSAVSRVTYADLFAVIGTTYGAGDGSTTFNLPDSRGRVVANINSADSEFDTVGEKYGAKTVTISITEMPSHNHNSAFATAGHTHTYSFWTGTLNYPDGKNRLDETNEQEGANVGHVHPISGTTGGPNATASVSAQGGGGTHNNIQPSIVQSFAMKY